MVAPRRQRSRPPRNGRGHSHGDGHHHHDLNLRAAYLHVLADALTSVLAIVALAGGRLFGWDWLDPVMGIVGAAVITVCAWGLLKQTRRVLLDREMDAPVVQVRDVIEGDGEAVVADLHVWRGGSGGKTPAVTLSQLRQIFTRLLRRPAPTAEEIAGEVTRVLRRSEESRIYHWHKATGNFPPCRVSSNTS